MTTIIVILIIFDLFSILRFQYLRSLPPQKKKKVGPVCCQISVDGLNRKYPPLSSLSYLFLLEK